MMKIIIKLLFSSFYLFTAASGQSEHLILRSRCVCPGYSLVYECTVKGRPEGVTVWQGTAFDCRSNEIALLHSCFSNGTFGVCNNGTIVGKSIGVRNDCYTSQLTFKLSTDMIRESIVCIHDDTMTITNIGSTRIVTTTVPFPPPDKLSVIHADHASRQLVFSWSEVAPDCPAIQYNILATNCGSCPTTTSHTTVTCTDVPLDGSTCILAVQTVVCGNVTGNSSDSVRGTLLKGSSGCAGAIASASLFAILLAVCVTVLTILITILVKNKVNIYENLVGLAKFKKAARVTESAYEDVRQRQQSINTRENIAYSKPLATSTTSNQQCDC